MKRRRPLTRQELIERLAPGLRPMLSQQQLVELGICHLEQLDAVATGNVGPDVLWDWVACMLTWWMVSRLVQAGMPEMDAQCEMVTRLVERFHRTGRVRFDGPDLQLARDGVAVMDQLAAMVSLGQAKQAAAWSEIEVDRIRAQTRLVPQEVAA